MKQVLKKSVLFFLAICFFFTIKIKAQEEEIKFGINFSGYVKNDVFFDSRQTVAVREGHFFLWPSPELLDEDGNDINAKPNLNILAIQSRLRGKITGPDAFGAKTSGLIEGDFFAQANDNINLFRLRHAFIKLNWTNTELLTGQYWNPLFVTGCFPGTVSFNTGTPLQSFARNPQIRLTQKIGGLSIIAAALSQRDYSSRGAVGPSSSYLRNSGIPDIHLQIHYNIKGTTGTNILLGAGLAYKTIVPRLVSEINDTISYKVDEKVSGLTVMGFAKIALKQVTIKLQGRYGENIADVLSISGFAVKEITNAITGESSYTPLKNITFWGEIHSNGKKIQVGVFGGYLKNQGTKETMSSVDNPVYGLATDIESLLRVSPRIIFISNKFKVAGEIEYTSASYGSNYDINYIPANTTTVANARILISTIYSF